MIYDVAVPLLLLDLDNTLIDRASAFRRWAEAYVVDHAPRASAEEVAWLVNADKNGYEPREILAAAIRDRYGLAEQAVADVVSDLRLGMVDQIRLDSAVPRALSTAQAAGWHLVVVTNGTVEQQERKLRRTGLDQHVDGWVISEAVGVKKPAPLIFERAAEVVDLPLKDAWMIGDSALADIAGAHQLGLRSVWLRGEQSWPELDFQPTMIMNDCADAIDHVVGITD